MNITRFFPVEKTTAWGSIRSVNDDPQPMNPGYFVKMAHGDVRGLRDLAFDYFNDTRRLMTGWVALIDAGDFTGLREELHRCKGGASLFGLERLVALIGDCERPMALETRGFDIVKFEKELTAAEDAITGMVETAC